MLVVVVAKFNVIRPHSIHDLSSETSPQFVNFTFTTNLHFQMAK